MPVYILKEFTRRTQHHVNVEESTFLLQLEKSNKNTDSDSGPKQNHDWGKRKNDDPHEDEGKKKKGEKYIPLYLVHTELNETQERIFLTNEQAVPFRGADNPTMPRRKRDMSNLCRYH